MEIFEMTDIPASELPTVLAELERENRFEVVETIDQGNGLFTLKVREKAASRSGQPASPPAGEVTKPKPGSSGNLFKEKAPGVMADLMKDFDFTKVQAAGILGNIGVESGGFTLFHEVGQPAEKGGVGWVQWTGKPGRRADFEAFCAKEGLDPKSDEANYGFIKHEMQNTSERKVVSRLKLQNTIDGAVETFMKVYERPGVPALPKRIEFARIALSAFDNAPKA